MAKPDRGGAKEPLAVPFRVLIDQREKLPYQFLRLSADAKDGFRPLVIVSSLTHLATGDYTVEGMESRVAVERKSLADLFGTLGGGRERFVRELERLNQLEYAAAVVEASWDDILRDPPPHSALNPKTIHRSVIAWQQRYPRVHWWMVGSRRLGEITTFRILERFHREDVANGNGLLVVR